MPSVPLKCNFATSTYINAGKPIYYDLQRQAKGTTMIKMTLTDDSLNFLIPGYEAWQVERCQAALFSIRTTSSPLWSPLRLEVCHRCDCTLPIGVSDAIADNHCLWSRRITTNHIFLCHSGLKFCRKWFPWAFLSAGNHQSPSLGQWSLQTLQNSEWWYVDVSLLPLFCTV